MNLLNHLSLMAEYNQVMNQRIYGVVLQLPAEHIYGHKGAFFGSIFGTLNHIAVGDTVWLKRIAKNLGERTLVNDINQLETPNSLNFVLCETIQDLQVKREHLDQIFLELSSSISEAELISSVTYKNMKGDEFSKVLFSLLMHVFNHQTHHRGQVTTLLSQLNVDFGSTDLAVLIPNV
jgi:uncharacterized damage-inducible protein DinB